MSREELEKQKADELAAICKNKGIKFYNGKSRFKKAEMIDAILKEQSQSDITKSETVENKIEKASVAVKEKEATSEQSNSKKNYITNITIGTLVAFREENGKLNTAAVQNASFKREQLKLITQYGKEYIVPFENIVWVRTKKRWPMFVLRELKEKGNAYATV